MDARARLLRHFARDLCVRTEAEVREIWTGDKLEALDRIEVGMFERYVSGHNPIYYLARQVWFDDDPSLLYAPLHKDQMCKELLGYYFQGQDDKVSGLIILVQRDSFKSTFNHGVFPQFLAMREKIVNNRDIRILLLHHREEQASLNLQRIKQKHIQSRFIRETFPEFHSANDFGTKTQFDWPCKKQGVFSEPSVFAAGIGARITGLHFDWSLPDDIVTEDDRTSKLIRDQSFFKYSTSRFMLDTKVGKEVITGTRYHLHDLYGKLIASSHRKSGNAMYRLLHIRAGGSGTDHPLSYPTRHTQEFLDGRRDEEVARSGNDILWWLQYQNEARSDRLVAADPSWIKYIKPEDVPSAMERCIIVDPAWKGTKNAGTGDDAAIAVVGFERRGFLVCTYLLDLVVSDTLTSLDGANTIFDLMRRWGVVDIAVEEHGGHAFRTDLENQALTRGRYINLVDLKSKQTNKQDRITTFLRRVQAGQFFILEGCPNRGIFLSQYEDFPQIEKDDALDCVSYSADPNIIERLATPTWNEEVETMWVPTEIYHRRTRHTTV